MKKKFVTLSARMQAITNMVTKGNIVCDVGCDHGFVSIYLIQQKISPKVFAFDISEGPLERAKEHIREYHLEKQIETRLSDGISKLSMGEADTLICAGMGARLIVHILEAEMDKIKEFEELILQPQSELGFFRKYLREHEFRIVDEDMVFEEGKYYPIMKIIRSDVNKDFFSSRNNSIENDCSVEEANIMQEVYDEYGKILLEKKHSILKQYLISAKDHTEKLIEKLEYEISNNAFQRKMVLKKELEKIIIALAVY